MDTINAPVDDRYGAPVCTVAVWQNLVVHADMLEALDDREWRTRNDRLDGPRRRLLAFDDAGQRYGGDAGRR